jgi:hypothetical protein
MWEARAETREDQGASHPRYEKIIKISYIYIEDINRPPIIYFNHLIFLILPIHRKYER